MIDERIAAELDNIVALAKTNPLAEVAISLDHNPEHIASVPFKEYLEGNRRIIISIIINDNPRAERFYHEFPTKPIQQ